MVLKGLNQQDVTKLCRSVLLSEAEALSSDTAQNQPVITPQELQEAYVRYQQGDGYGEMDLASSPRVVASRILVDSAKEYLLKNGFAINMDAEQGIHLDAKQLTKYSLDEAIEQFAKSCEQSSSNDISDESYQNLKSKIFQYLGSLDKTERNLPEVRALLFVVSGYTIGALLREDPSDIPEKTKKLFLDHSHEVLEYIDEHPGESIPIDNELIELLPEKLKPYFDRLIRKVLNGPGYDSLRDQCYALALIHDDQTLYRNTYFVTGLSSQLIKAGQFAKLYQLWDNYIQKYATTKQEIQKAQAFLEYAKLCMENQRSGSPIPLTFENSNSQETDYMTFFHHDFYNPVQRSDSLSASRLSDLSPFIKFLAGLQKEKVTLEDVDAVESPKLREILKALLFSAEVESYHMERGRKTLDKLGLHDSSPIPYIINPYLLANDAIADHTMKRVSRILEQIKKARQYFKNMVGQDPQDENAYLIFGVSPGSVNRSHRSGTGVIFFDLENYIPENVVIHEYTHALDPMLRSARKEHWTTFGEGLAKYMESIYARDVNHTSHHPYMDPKAKDLDDNFSSDRRFFRANNEGEVREEKAHYTLGYLIWKQIEEDIGQKKLNEFLKEYFKLDANHVTQDEIEALFVKYTGQNTQQIYDRVRRDVDNVYNDNDPDYRDNTLLLGGRFYNSYASDNDGNLSVGSSFFAEWTARAGMWRHTVGGDVVSYDLMQDKRHAQSHSDLGVYYRFGLNQEILRGPIGIDLNIDSQGGLHFRDANMDQPIPYVGGLLSANLYLRANTFKIGLSLQASANYLPLDNHASLGFGLGFGLTW